MNRRQFVKYLGVAAAGGVALSGLDYLGAFRALTANNTGTEITSSTSNSSSVGSADFPPQYNQFLNWLSSVSKPFVNQSINILLEEESTPRAVQKRDIDFFSTTQINSQYNIQPYFYEVQDLSLMIGTKSSSYDVFSVDHQDISYFKDSIISPTQLAEQYPDLTYAPIKQSDFQALPWSLVATYPPSSATTSTSNNAVLFIPFDMPIMIQYYRKDLYKSLGLSPAQTWDDYISNAQTLSSKGSIHFGFVIGAQPSISVVYYFLNHLASFGGELWQIEGGNLVSGLGSSQAQDALDSFVSLSSISDLSSYTYDWDDVEVALSKNVAAQSFEWYDLSYLMEDPVRSLVVGNMGYAANPKGPNGAFSTYGGSGVGVSKYSKNPEAAWLWVQWATAYGTQMMLLLDSFHVLPTRIGVVNEPLIQNQLGASNYPALQVAEQIWNTNQITSLTPFSGWWNAQSIISSHLSNAFAKKESTQTALQSIVQQIEALGTLTF